MATLAAHAATPIFDGLLPVEGDPGQVVAADFNSDGVADLAVVHVPPGGEPTLSTFVGTRGFGPAAAWSTSPAPYSHLAAGDVDADGRPDLVAVSWSPAQVVVRNGLGDGRFGPAVAVAALSGPTEIALADLDMDGRTDIVIADEAGRALRLLPSHPSGGFGPERRVDTQHSPRGVAAGDINLDGITDLVTANRSQATVSVLVGTGGGEFGAPTNWGAGGCAVAVVIANLDADAWPEVASANECSGTVSIFKFVPGPYYGTRADVMAGAAPSRFAVTDDDADGVSGLLVMSSREPALYGLGTVWTVGWDGVAAFSGHLAIPQINLQPVAIAAGDFDADGASDVAVSILDPERVWVARGDGRGAFGALPIYPAGEPFDLVLGDFDEDGRVDAVVSDAGTGEIALLPGIGSGAFGDARRIPAGSGPAEMTTADFNRDGHLDLALVDQAVQRVLVLLGDGQGRFSSGPDIDLSPYQPADIVASDLDLDGFPDLAVTNRRGDAPAGDDGSVAILLSIGGHSFTPPRLEPAGAAPGPVRVADVDHDGSDDLVVLNRGIGGVAGSGFVATYLGRSDGTVAAPLRSVLGQYDARFSGPLALVLGDFDHDGSIDAAVTFGGQGRDHVSFLRGTGSGQFSEVPRTLEVGRGARGAVAADFDGDGIDDLLVANATSSDISLLRGTGQPYSFHPPSHSLAPEVRYPAWGCPIAPAIGDVDQDGWTDVVVGRSCAHDIAVLLNRTPAADHDGDGIADGDDGCTDTDGDGFAEPRYPATDCPRDNCGGVPNPTQADTDGDGTGDACDTCPGLAQRNQFDSDRDGRGDLCDNCATAYNPDQVDSDDDRRGDACDNCPANANPDQADDNADGSGDACQPALRIDSVTSDNAGNLIVSGRASDPQGEPLFGSVGVWGTGVGTLTLPDIGVTSACEGFVPDGIEAGGVGYVNASAGTPLLFDLDELVNCDDALPDFLIAVGTCAEPTSGFNTILGLDVIPVPSALCFRRMEETSGGFDVTLLEVQPDHAVLGLPGEAEVIHVSFANGLPRSVPLVGLAPGVDYSLRIEVMDGTTHPVRATADFHYRGEGALLFDFGTPPMAVLTLPLQVECDSPGGRSITLDGSQSSDADSTPGTHDDIVSFAWYEDHGLPSESLLGTGETLGVMLPLGAHAITLVVTDSAGETGAAATTVTVVDTTPPVLACPAAQPAVECTGAGGAYATLAATAHDLCGGAVVVGNDRTANGADASDTYLLGTTAIGFTATDERGNVAACAAAVTVVDTLAPTLTLSTDPARLWPPNHEMIPVAVAWQAADICDPAPRVELVSIASSEPDDATGKDDGETMGDIGGAAAGTPDAEVLLRAERDGKGSGRSYTLRYRAVDGSGHATPAVAVVTVPHDQGHGPEPLLLQVEPSETGLRIYWPPVPEAGAYDVIRGRLSNVRLEGREARLGMVEGLARVGETWVEDGLGEPVPPVGDGYFYLVQSWRGQVGTGYGTESCPWPRVADGCTGVCVDGTGMTGVQGMPTPRPGTGPLPATGTTALPSP